MWVWHGYGVVVVWVWVWHGYGVGVGVAYHNPDFNVDVSIFVDCAFPCSFLCIIAIFGNGKSESIFSKLSASLWDFISNRNHTGL